jgi:putative ABC transport system substrate-binding protein
VVNGAPFVEMPMDQPTRFELVLNMKTAKALGVDVPASLISRVDDLIE